MSSRSVLASAASGYLQEASNSIDPPNLTCRRDANDVTSNFVDGWNSDSVGECVSDDLIMSRDEELAALPSSSRIRPRSPEPFERNVRQKTTPPAISTERARRDAAVAQLAADTAVRDETMTVKREDEPTQRLEDILGDDAWAMDEDGDTALTHVVIDHAEHPMYERHVKRVLRTMCTAPFGGPLTSNPLPTLRSISYKAASEGKQSSTKRLLTQCWVDEILQHIGEVMETSEQGHMSAVVRVVSKFLLDCSP